jgi:hypothetical protein
MSLINQIDHLLGGSLHEAKSESIFNGENIASEENIESALKVSEGLEVYASLLLKYIAKFESVLPSGLATKVKKLLDDPKVGFDYSLDSEGKKELATLWKELQKVDKFFASTFFCEIFTETNFHSMCKLIKTEWIAKTRISSNESLADDDIELIEETESEYFELWEAIEHTLESLNDMGGEELGYPFKDTANGKIINKNKSTFRDIPKDETELCKKISDLILEATKSFELASAEISKLKQLIKPRVDKAEKDRKDLDL